MQRHSRWPAAGFATAMAAAVILLAPATARADDSYPADPAEAERFYESEVDNWIEGPTRLIMTEEEQNAWEGLLSSEDRLAFIDWFWERRDPDLRTRPNEGRAEFYARVAEANRKYRGFPRGWNSDRGRVHVILGRPHSVRPSFGGPADTEVWTYFTTGPRADDLPIASAHGEFSILFVRRNTRSGFEVYDSFGGPGIYPLYLREAFHYAAQATIINNDLKARRRGR